MAFGLWCAARPLYAVGLRGGGSPAHHACNMIPSHRFHGNHLFLVLLVPISLVTSVIASEFPCLGEYWEKNDDDDNSDRTIFMNCALVDSG